VSLGALLQEAAQIFMDTPVAAGGWHHLMLWGGVAGGLAAVALLTRNALLELRSSAVVPE